MKLPKISILTGLFAALLLILPLVLILPANAIGEGQIEGGDIYRVRNVSQGTDFTDPINTRPCEIIQYKLRVHNPGPGVIKNVNISVSLPNEASTTNVSSATVTADNAQPSSTSDTATVNISSDQSIAYINGSTQLLDPNGSVISSLPDSLISGGINIGDVGISVNKLRFIQFKAKINCSEKPPEKPSEKPPQKPEKPTGVVAPTKPQQPPSQQPPGVTALPATGPVGDVAAIVFSVTIASSAAYYVVSRRLSII